jgi:hypothetical protein
LACAPAPHHRRVSSRRMGWSITNGRKIC